MSQPLTSADGAQAAGKGPPKILRGLTLRALIYGTLFSFLLGVADPYMYMVCSAVLCANSTPVGAVFLFAIAVFIFSMLMRGLDNLCGGRSPFGWLKLRAAELVVVYIMLLVTSAIPTFGFSETFIAMLSGPAHLSTDTNAWSEKVLPHMNPDILPMTEEQLEAMTGVTKDLRRLEPDHIKWLYDGMPDIEGLSFLERVKKIPWQYWVRPFLVWMIFIFTMYFVMMCIVSILRKQWVERERLQYPLVQLPMAMVDEANIKKGVPALFRNKILWIGFALPMLLTTWNQLAHFYQLVTPIKTSTNLQLFNRQMNLTLQLNWPVIGFTYLIKLEVALSLWVFCLGGAFVGQALTNLGFRAGERDMWLWRGHEHPMLYHACFGGVIMLALLTLWSARRSILDVVRKACGAGRDVDDRNEPLPHTVAFWGLIAGIVGMVWWMCSYTGMSPGFATLFVVLAMLGLLAATRMIAEGGLVFVQFPMQLQSFVFRIFDQARIGPANLVGMGWAGTWVGDIRVIMMPAFANATKLADYVRLKQRSLIILFPIAIVVALVASSFVVLYVGYTRGAAKTDTWIWASVPNGWFGKIGAANIPDAKQREAGGRAGERWFPSRLWATIIGVLFMLFLTVMRGVFLWWPLHPLGFPFAITPAMQRLWLCVAIGWLLKAIILRYGGAVLFRKLKPFFYGLILGEFASAGLWYVFYFVYVTWFHGTGNLIYN